MSLSQCFSELYWMLEVKRFLLCNLLNNLHRGFINFFRRSLILFALLSFCSFCFLCGSKQILLTFLGCCCNLCFCLRYSTFERSDFSVCLFMQSCKSFFDLRIVFCRDCFVPSLINPFCLLAWGLAALFHDVFLEDSSSKVDKLILWFFLLLFTFLTCFLSNVLSSLFPAFRQFNFSNVGVVD